MLKSANELADAVAKADILDDAQKASTFRRFQRMGAKGVVDPVLDDDARSTRLFDEPSCAVLLMLAPLSAMVVEVGTLREVSAKLLAPSIAGKRPIDRLVAAVRDGRRADLVVSLERVGTEPQGLAVRVEIEGEEPSADVAAIIGAHRYAAVEVLAEMRVNANSRLAPLVAVEG